MSTPRDRIEARLGLTGPPLRRLHDTPPQVPDHELIRRIGQGGYGEVWLARNALGTWRAVKIVFRDHFKDARPYEREFTGIRRFEPLSRSNEGFVDILQVGRFDPPRRDELRESPTSQQEACDGWFYYVMELADTVRSQEPEVRSQKETPKSTATEILNSGSCLLDSETYSPRTLSSDLARRGRLPLEDCLQLGLTLSLALGHLHRHGLIHRDVKPSNIIFVGGVPKLADIGLVTEASGANTFVGTEGFVPPEGPTSPQADIYALGKVLYETAMGKDRHEFPEPFTQISADSESVALMELNAVLLRACAPDPKARYASAEEMHADLALLHSGGSVKRRHQFDRQFLIAKQVGAVAIVATLLIGTTWFWQRQQTQKMTRLSEEKTALAWEKTRLADNLTQLDAENRNRIVRLDVANGVRLLDEGDAAGALLWFADALPLVTDKPAEESIHRIRIQQTLNQIPRVLQVLPHENGVTASDFSYDARHFVTGTDSGKLCVWDTRTGAPLWPPRTLNVDRIWQARFTHDGQRVFVSYLRPHGWVDGYVQVTNTTEIIEAESGHPIFSLVGTNLIRADLSPDDRWVVTADTAHLIRVHDARDGRLISELTGHTNLIVQFAFSTNGTVLASSSEDDSIRLWRLPFGEPLGAPIPYETGLIALSHDGSLLATGRTTTHGETNSTVQTWGVPSGASDGTPIEMPGTIGVLWFVTQGEHELFIMTDKQCALFDAKSHKQLLQLVNPSPGSRCFSVSADGRRIAFGGSGGLEGVWSLETGERLLPPCLRDRPLTDVNFSPDGSQLIATSSTGEATLLSLHFPIEDASYRFDSAIHRGEPKTLLEWRRFTPDRRHFLLILSDGTVRRVDFERMTDEKIPAPPINGIRAVQATFDTSGKRGAIWYSGAGTNLVEIWGEVGGITNRFVLRHPVGLSDKMLFTLDGSRLITPGSDHQIRFWRTADGTLERSVAVAEAIDSPPLFPDGNTALGVSSITRRFTLFDLATGLTAPAPLPPMNIDVLCFNSSGDRFASVGEVNWSRVWNARTCESLSPPLEHGGRVRWVDWSPDDRRLLTAGLTPEVKIWDATTGEQLLAPLRLGSKPLETALWSLDGRFIVARSDEDMVRVWDSVTGEAVTPLIQHSGYVRLAHLVANSRLITLSLPNLMRAWDLTETHLTSDEIADYAKLVAGRRLNAAGVLLPLKPDELAELSRSLRTRAPQMFD
jgi:WD40 repeat protein/serine/threonine protein kinase